MFKTITSNYSKLMDNVINKKYKSDIRNKKWLEEKFNTLHGYLSEIIDYDDSKVLILEPFKNKELEIEKEVLVIIETSSHRYFIKAKVLENKDKWDDEHWIQNSSITCDCENKISGNNKNRLIGGVYSYFTWSSIRNSIIRNEIKTVDVEIFQ